MFGLLATSSDRFRHDRTLRFRCVHRRVDPHSHVRLLRAYRCGLHNFVNLFFFRGGALFNCVENVRTESKVMRR